MSALIKHPQTDVLEHDPASNTKRVMLYGWDADGLQGVRIQVDSSGNLVVDDFMTNNVETNSGNTYIGEEKKSGEWRFKKITSTNGFSYATVVNNPTKTSYALAYASFSTLNYGDPTQI